MQTEMVALPAGSPDRELSAMALDFRATLPLDTKADIPATIAAMEAALQPLKATEPHAVVRDADQPSGFRFEGNATPRLKEALTAIGIKMNPTMGAEQVGAWLAAMVASLADLPGRFAVRGAVDALHVPIRFFPEVEGVVREKAQKHEDRYRLAISRLRRLAANIAEANRPKLEAPGARDAGPEELAAMAKSEMGRTMLGLGLDNGHITQEQFDAAMASLVSTEETTNVE